MESENGWQANEMHVVSIYGFRQFTIPEFVKEAVRSLSAGAKVLDLGCGAGGAALYLRSLGLKVFASDLDCGPVVQNCKRLKLSDIFIKECSFMNIPYEKSSFDSVISLSVLHHAIFSDIKKGFREIYRILRPGGLFLFDFLSVYDESFGTGTEIERNTFVGSRRGEEDVPHHYADECEIKSLTDRFGVVRIEKSVTTCSDLPEPYSSRDFQVTAIK